MNMISARVKEILLEANLAHTHWGKRIIKAAEQQGFTFGDCHDAESWQTCACGKQDPRLHCNDGQPKDYILMELGCEFNVKVENDLFVQAAECLVKIENRATYLLIQQGLIPPIPMGDVPELEPTLKLEHE